MHRIPRIAAGTGALLASLALAAPPVGAGGTAPPLELDPTSGPPGTEITVSGEDCSTKGDTWVVLELRDTEGNVQDDGEVDVDESDFAGEWTASLMVPADTTDYGDWTVEATCEVRFVSEARAGRSLAGRDPLLFEYPAATFTVTAPAQEPSTTEAPTTTEPPATSPVVAQPTYTG